ncbi:L,D-transpeptidase family protein [Aquamicrobium sp. LC103]|uniref:L,D-transpeptidase family protein n=1 Tax=Aquamicrobium sp. LC103 TaxID=1120658 RepID=UPI00063ECA84|nr:L,D-transpeptidase family protein [Aquamicrobium sp. LC103]TKT79181.1 L,D-transpeptidase [Aquamicrobium sp. LC103]
MKFLRRDRLAFSCSSLAVVLALSAAPASAQTLLERFFNVNRSGPQVERQAPPPQAAPAARAVPAATAPARRAAPPPRVSGPQYYDYKTDSLVRVDFSALALAMGALAPHPASIDPGTVGATEKVESDTDEATAASSGVREEMPEAADRQGASDDSGEAAGQPRTAATEAAAETASERREIEAGTGAVAAISAVAVISETLTAEEIASLQSFELFAEKGAAEAIAAHYAANPSFIWVSDGKPNDRAREALTVLGDARSHGLDPADYSVTVPNGSGEEGKLTAEGMARFEMTLSARMLRYARDARSGRVDPNRLSGYHDFKIEPVDHAGLLEKARTSDDVAAFLEGQHPRNAFYKALRVELEMLRASTENEIVIAPDTLVRPGESNPEFPKILSLISAKADAAFRTAHGETLTRHLGSETYAQELIPVIKAAQLAAGLKDDGVIGPRTVQVLAGDSKASRIAKVEVALEQLRWLPSDFGDRYVFLNTPAMDATYVEGGKEKLSMRTVVGSLATQTYFFKDEISYVEFHPYWGVPRSILVNKYLPKLYSDPSYLDRNGFEVVNSKGQTIPSSAIGWGQYGANVPYSVRQRPGAGNALGELKIMFPNKHAIYMHDTPEKHLFGRDSRAVSNGCIRLQDPRAMAAAVLGWDRGRLDQRFNGRNSRANLDVKVPVYVAYFTAWPDAAGEVHYHHDVYGRDAKVLEALAKVESLRAPSI